MDPLCLYLNNTILIIQTLTQANSCIVAMEISFWTAKCSIGIYKYGGMLNLFIFPLLTIKLMALWNFRLDSLYFIWIMWTLYAWVGEAIQ